MLYRPHWISTICAALAGILPICRFRDVLQYGSRKNNELYGQDFLLPGDVIPHHYLLTISTDMDKFSYLGEVNIQIECIKPTKMIKLHSKDLIIDKQNMYLKRIKDKHPIGIENSLLAVKKDFLVILLKEELKAGSRYNLKIFFSGNLNDQHTGYYRTAHRESVGRKTNQWLAATIMEPTFARTVFPCFDEPAMKAQFTIRLGHAPGLTSLSNMPLRATTKTYWGKRWVWDEYKTSPRMSTYLVAFVVGNLDSRKSKRKNDKFRMWTSPGKIPAAEFAGNIGPHILSFFESFYGIPYPLPKIDIVAVPDMYSLGMENWGLVIIREKGLLSTSAVDESWSYNPLDTGIPIALAHELAHQWFGNLVTLQWWNDAWLNEGFATFNAAFAMKSHVLPEYELYTYEVTKWSSTVFEMDALETSLPIRRFSTSIQSTNEIADMFGFISYYKGALLLHMLIGFLGEDVFRTGLTTYLKKNAFKNADQDMLWGEFSEAASGKQVLPPGVGLNEVMDTWTLNAGYPVLTTTRKGGELTITQKRFLSTTQPDLDEEPPCWWVPILFYTASHAAPAGPHWLGCGQPSLTINTGATADQWVLLNYKSTGLYRVNYDKQSWELLVAALQGPDRAAVDVLDRTRLVADALELARVGQLDYETALRVLWYLQNETAAAPWHAALDVLQDLEDKLRRTDGFVVFKKAMSHLLPAIYRHLRDARLTDVGALALRGPIMRWACEYDVDHCVQRATQTFSHWMDSNEPVPEYMRGVVYCEGVKRGGEDEWNHAWQVLQQLKTEDEQREMVSALACSTMEKQLNRLLASTLDIPAGVSNVLAVHAFQSVAKISSMGFNLAVNFIRGNADIINERLEEGIQCIEKVAAQSNSKNEFDTMLLPLQEAVPKLKQLIQPDNKRIDWMDNKFNSFKQALFKLIDTVS